ncbi:hypothetical protein EYF80_003639 [Liparis tanakae]|uniref:Uncharacterized protein n=1 Tax=Liparis tanakae TaxID=230148 RepID=A0A4Z2J9Y4_9TELE|nr:hypothetical protein EYF80_003639 [Liparis tanakae]
MLDGAFSWGTIDPGVKTRVLRTSTMGRFMMLNVPRDGRRAAGRRHDEGQRRNSGQGNKSRRKEADEGGREEWRQQGAKCCSSTLLTRHTKHRLSGEGSTGARGQHTAT